MYVSVLRENLPRVMQAIGDAAHRAGRDPGEIELVAITKGHPPEAAEAALDAGIGDLGENRVEELEEKVTAVGRERARWHMVGHLQSRKARELPGLCDLLHSLDTVRLAEKLSRIVSAAGSTLSVLVQVNASGEESKTGLRAEEALEVTHEIVELPGLRVEGLMTMAPFTDEENALRSTFRKLRDIHERLGSLGGYTGATLSMGMTNDYTIAIEEGSTMLRLGTALFGERPR
jgi:pyridoxal phosphate enzyme (YggS family)